MAEELGYVTFDTDWGWVGVAGTAAGVRCLVLPRPSPEEARQRLRVDAATWSPEVFADLVRRLRAYFGGDRVSFKDTIDYGGATDFQRRVWAAARHIPYSETVSYGWLARAIGRPGSARAVGQALARNQVPVIVPCHRVVGGGGRLGGFGGGVEIKRRLLALERGNRPGGFS